MEDSQRAVIREIKEETGLDTVFVKDIAFTENFFVSSFNNKKIS